MKLLQIIASAIGSQSQTGSATAIGGSVAVAAKGGPVAATAMSGADSSSAGDSVSGSWWLTRF